MNHKNSHNELPQYQDEQKFPSSCCKCSVRFFFHFLNDKPREHFLLRNEVFGSFNSRPTVCCTMITHRLHDYQVV